MLGYRSEEPKLNTEPGTRETWGRYGECISSPGKIYC